MLFDRIVLDKNKARAEGNITKRDLLGTLQGELEKDCKLGDKGLKIVPNDIECKERIKKFIDNANYVIEKLGADSTDFRKALAKEEIRILSEYMPKKMTEEELKFTIAILVENGAKNLGAIMADLKANFKDRYDGKLASDIAKEILNG